MLRQELTKVLAEQGVASDPRLALFDLEEGFPYFKARFGDEAVIEIAKATEVTRVARSRNVVVVVSSVRSVAQLFASSGFDASEVGVIAVGRLEASQRIPGLFGVVDRIESEELLSMIRRAAAFRALRALELLHRCEARRLLRREMDLIGHPRDELSDDVATFQPPPLPVGMFSPCQLEPLADAFERAYIDRVQLLCESAREAARHLDVSAATLARRLRREGQLVAEPEQMPT